MYVFGNFQFGAYISIVHIPELGVLKYIYHIINGSTLNKYLLYNPSYVKIECPIALESIEITGALKDESILILKF